MLKKLFSPFGRLSRGGMWLWGVLVLGLVTMAASAMDYKIFKLDFLNLAPNVSHIPFSTEMQFSNVVFWLTLWPTMALSIKRFHDVNISGWVYVIIYLVLLLVGEIFTMQNLNVLSPGWAIVASFVGLKTEALFRIAQALPTVGFYSYFAVNSILGLALVVIALVVPGNIGDNRYGSDPLED